MKLVMQVDIYHRTFQSLPEIVKLAIAEYWLNWIRESKLTSDNTLHIHDRISELKKVLSPSILNSKKRME